MFDKDPCTINHKHLPILFNYLNLKWSKVLLIIILLIYYVSIHVYIIIISKKYEQTYFLYIKLINVLIFTYVKLSDLPWKQ